MKDFTWRDFERIFFHTLFAVGTILGFWFHEMESKKQHAEAMQLQKEQNIAEEKRDKIRMNMALFEKVNEKIEQTRYLVDIIKKQCELKSDIAIGASLENYESRRKAVYQLIAVADSIEQSFGIVSAKWVKGYIEFYYENNNPCAKNAPSLEVYKNKANKAVNVLKKEMNGES